MSQDTGGFKATAFAMEARGLAQLVDVGGDLDVICWQVDSRQGSTNGVVRIHSACHAVSCSGPARRLRSRAVDFSCRFGGLTRQRPYGSEVHSARTDCRDHHPRRSPSTSSSTSVQREQLLTARRSQPRRRPGRPQHRRALRVGQRNALLELEDADEQTGD